MAIYSDINYIDLKREPRVTDIDDVYQAIYTLLTTRVGQRIFRPNYGSYLDNYLFEPCDEDTADRILFDIITTITQEPRVQLNRSQTTVTPLPEKNMFAIRIVFTVLGFSDTERSMNLTLKTKYRNNT